MNKKIILTLAVVLSLLTYKFKVLIPLGFILVVFYLYRVHKMLLLNKQIIDDNIDQLNTVIKTLLSNQKVLSSDIKSLKALVEKQHVSKKTITQEVKKNIRRTQ